MGEGGMSERVIIIGAGAVGGYLGAYLARAGHAPVLVDAWPEHVMAMRRDGLDIRMMEADESFRTPVRALHISDVPQLVREAPFDIAIIAVKSYDTAWATALVLPYLSPDGCIISAQNSINEDTIAAVAGWGRVLGLSVNVLAAELVAPGRIERNSLRATGDKLGLVVGEVHGRITPRAQRIAALCALGDTAGVTSNLWGERWSKLTINAMRNGVCAMTGMSSKQRDYDPAVRLLSVRLGSQSVRVGRAMGLALEPMSGLDLDMLARAEAEPAAMEAVIAQILDVVEKRGDSQRPSMGQDILKGRRTESAMINGLVARRGHEFGVDARLHGKVDEIVRRIERGEARPDPALARAL
jgi:2-dehydropantoate 2-reductase